MAVVGPENREEKIEDVICTKIEGVTQNTGNIRNLESLIDAALPWVESKVDELSAQIKSQLEARDYDVLLAQPEPEAYSAPRAEDVSGSR
jgi:hypothetical protein